MTKTSGMRIVSEYIVVDGEKREIDFSSTDLPLRCKLAWAEMVTGKRHVAASPDDSPKSNKHNTSDTSPSMSRVGFFIPD